MDIEYRAQSGQDAWVVACYGGRRDLRFADVGAGDPVQISNTFALERSLEWSGVLCDIATIDRLQAVRSKANAYVDDALSADWHAVFDRQFGSGPKVIHYLSLDLEPASSTLAALSRLLETEWIFGCLTVEHDRYRFGRHVQVGMQAMLASAGYRMVLQDARVLVDGTSVPFEDWWIHPDLHCEFVARRLAEQIQTSYLAGGSS